VPDQLRPRVIDFGIAKGTQNTVLTLADRVVGSPGFMSPEQATGRDIGPASDMFSLGGVLIFAATGLPPFYGRAADITFTDAAATRLLVYWLDYRGKRRLLVTLGPGDSRQVKGNIGDAWQVADTSGCVAGFISTGTGHVTIGAAAGMSPITDREG
jgi:serine/threonine protein kinase